MINGIDNIRIWFVQNKICFWRLRESSGVPCGVSDTENKEQDQPTALNQFECFYDILEPGRYQLEGWNRVEDKRNNLKIFIVKPSNAKTAEIGSIQQIGFTPEQLTEQIREATVNAVNEYKKAQEWEAMQEELKELRNSTNGFDRILNSPLGKQAVIGGLNFLSNLANPKAHIGQTQKTNNTMNQADKEKLQDASQLEKSLADWSEAEPQLVAIISKLSEMAKNNDPMYDIAKQTLLK